MHAFTYLLLSNILGIVLVGFGFVLCQRIFRL